MPQITIAGKKYELGDVPFTDENLDVFDAMLDDGQSGKRVTMKDLRRILNESLVSGNGEEKASEAMAGLRFNFSKDSDLLKALTALGEQLKGNA